MLLFPPPLEISDTEGFTKEKDIFGRSTIGQGLTNIVMNVANSTVIAIDGQWGSGKTIFLKMWAGELRKLGFPVVYIDAFKNDYAEDAFTAIASEIILLAQEQRKIEAPAAKKFVTQAIGAGKIILRSGIKLGVKLATAGALEASDLGALADDVAKETSELEDKYLGELLTKQSEQKQAIQLFQEALAELPSLLATEKENAAPSTAKPLVVIIDELDRCRPSFALQILERIKHFFAVPHVHFVLGAHLTQLQNSVMVAYGSQIDALNYLQKFIHLTLHLTDTTNEPSRRVRTKYIQHLLYLMEFQQDQTAQYAASYYQHTAECHNLSLRAIERIMSTLAISLTYKPDSLPCPTTILVALCLLKITNPPLYVKAKEGRVSFDELRVPLGFAAEANDEAKNALKQIGDYWLFCTLPNIPENSELNRFNPGLRQFDIERQQIVPLVANAVIDRLTPA
jgi:hypothetical protein